MGWVHRQIERAWVVVFKCSRGYHGAAAKQGLEQPRWQYWLDTAVWGQPASHQVIVPSGGGSRGTSNSSGDHVWGQNREDPWGEGEEEERAPAVS